MSYVLVQKLEQDSEKSPSDVHEAAVTARTRARASRRRSAEPPDAAARQRQGRPQWDATGPESHPRGLSRSRTAQAVRDGAGPPRRRRHGARRLQGAWRKRVGVEPTGHVSRIPSDLKSVRPTGRRSSSRAFSRDPPAAPLLPLHRAGRASIAPPGPVRRETEAAKRTISGRGAARFGARTERWAGPKAAAINRRRR